MSIIVTGLGKHGKDEFCKLLNIPYKSSSWTACELFLFEKYRHEFGYATPEECYVDRHNHRQMWFEDIKAFNDAHGLDSLAREIFDHVPIYCGIRNKEELDVVKENRLVRLVIWIDATERKGITEDSSSMTVTKDDAHIIVDNNGTVEDLRQKALVIRNILMLGLITPQAHGYFDATHL